MTRHGGDIYKISEVYGLDPTDIIDFSSNINLLGTPPGLRKIFQKNFHLLKSYPDPDYMDLKKAIGNFNDTEPDCVIPGNGATELIYLIPRAVAPKKSLIAAPAFSEYGKSLKQAKSAINYFRLREDEGFGINHGKLIKEIRRGYQFIVLCNPNNPTGNFFKTDIMGIVFHEAKKNDSLVMVDESFIEFVDGWKDISSLPLAKKYSNVIILRSMTKFFAIPGLRLGYALTFNRRLNQKLIAMKEPWSVNIIADLAARTLLMDENFIKKTVKALNKEREFLLAELRRINGIKAFNASANFILIKILSKTSSGEMKEKLLKNKILIRDASNFKFLNSKFIRVAVRGRRENEGLVGAMKKLFNSL